MLTWGKECCRGTLFITEKYFMFHFLSFSVSWKTIYSILTSYKMLILTVICHVSINVPMLFISSDVHVCKFRKEAIRVLNCLNGSDVTVVHMLLWHDERVSLFPIGCNKLKGNKTQRRGQTSSLHFCAAEKIRWRNLSSGETSREASRSYETASYKSKSASLTKKEEDKSLEKETEFTFINPVECVWWHEVKH